LRHLEKRGRSTRDFFPLLRHGAEGGEEQGGEEEDEEKAVEFKVFSTNYQRTQLSAQAFLKGLGAPEGTAIEVLASEECPLSLHDHDPELSVRLTQQVQNTSAFRREEEQFLDDHGEHFISAVPELGTARDVYTFNVPVKLSGQQNKEAETEADQSQTSRKKINWMAALDYFSCRNAHDLPLHQELEEPHHAENMSNYVTSRFQLYYEDKEMRKIAVLPMLKHVVLKQFLSCIVNLGYAHAVAGTTMDDNQARIEKDAYKKLPVLIFSGHDVNLMGLLVTLNSSGSPQSKTWPGYGATLAFELVHEKVNEGDQEEDNFLVNAYYNEKPLPIKLSLNNNSENNSVKLTDLIDFCDRM
jgi:hypothetical protein